MLHYIFGDEFLVQQQVKNLIQSAKTKHGNDLVIHKVNGQEINDKELHSLCFGQDLFAPQSLIIINHLLEKAPSEKVTSVIESLIEKQNTLVNEIIIVQNGDPKKSKLATALAKLPNAKYFDEMSTAQLTSLLLTRAKELHALLPNTSASLLIASVGQNAYLLLQELEKLSAYANCKTIDKSMIDLLVPHENFDEIFSFLDAVAQKNKALALKLFEQQIKKGEAELMILNSLVRQIRTLIHIKSFVEKNGAISSDAIAQTLSIHPYVAKKSISQAQQFTTTQLNSIYKYLLAIDRGIKNSFLDPQTLIETMIVKI